MFIVIEFLYHFLPFYHLKLLRGEIFGQIRIFPQPIFFLRSTDHPLSIESTLRYLSFKFFQHGGYPATQSNNSTGSQQHYHLVHRFKISQIRLALLGNPIHGHDPRCLITIMESQKPLLSHKHAIIPGSLSLFLKSFHDPIWLFGLHNYPERAGNFFLLHA